MDWSWYFSIRSSPDDFDTPTLLFEIVIFFCMSSFICAADAYILWSRQDAAHLVMAVGVNFVVLFSYWFFYSYRNASSSGAAQEDVPQSVKGDGLDDKQSDLQKRDNESHTFTIGLWSCISTGAFLVAMAALITSTIRSSASQGGCTAVEYHDDRYKYAVRAKGTCQAAAEPGTILGSLLDYVDKELPSSVCGMHCIMLTQGGGWEGYVMFGAKTYDWEQYLNRSYLVAKYGQCKEGEKKYAETLEVASDDSDG